MPFHIQPLKEFLVRPALPASLSRMPELAFNLFWSWDHTVRSLFRRLDPVLWKAVNHNPILLLGRVSPSTLAKLGSDSRYLALYRRACDHVDTYLNKSSSEAPPE